MLVSTQVETAINAFADGRGGAKPKYLVLSQARHDDLLDEQLRDSRSIKPGTRLLRFQGLPIIVIGDDAIVIDAD